jgi:uncharacterized protein (DUF305 family)
MQWCPRRPDLVKRWLALVVVATAMAGCSSSSDANTGGSGTGTAGAAGAAGSMARPGEASVEAGFARDMSVHHAQAVAMAEAIRDRTSDPDLKLLATDIALGQQGQIGRMSGWLDEWGLNQTSTTTPMAWIRSDNLLAGAGAGMGDMASMGSTPGADASMVMTADGRMPGMATRPQVSALSTLPLADAEISFLQLMIAHHRAGVEMAQAVLARTARPDVVQLATSIVNGQQAEITVMTDMLAKRGATP